MVEFLYGKSPILEAIRAKRRNFHKFYFLAGAKADPSLEEALAWAGRVKIPIQWVSRGWLEERIPQGPTQGWVAEVSEYPYCDFEELRGALKDKAPAMFLALDQIQDPQNLGSILRTAEGCGVDGVLLPQKRASPVSPAVVKASAGATEFLKISRVKNLVRALESLKKLGYWAVGTSVEEAENALFFQWPEKTILILGSEGLGMRRLVKESCDFLIHVPQVGRIASLNVSVSAAVCLYLRMQKSSPGEDI